MCGIMGVFATAKAAELVAIGLHAQQHRARDFAGIASTDGRHMYRYGGPGITRQVFNEARLNELHGRAALGHIRYATVKNAQSRDNIQPVMGNYGSRTIAIAHNGNLTNVEELRDQLKDQRFATFMDTEIILRLLEERDTGDIVKDLKSVLPLLKGSFELGILLPDCLIAVCDPWENHPMSVGIFPNEGFCIASENCAFTNIDASEHTTVKRGTMVIITDQGIRHEQYAPQHNARRCVFELLYYASPSSYLFGASVTSFREHVGQKLEALFPVLQPDAVVTPVPDSANFMAIGYARSGRSGTYRPVILRNHYIGRTFVAARQANRDEEVARKFLWSEDEIVGKCIVVVDDSMVRGTTSQKLVALLKRLGAKEVHLRIGTPPIIGACRYGINMVDEDGVKLISAEHSPAEICNKLGADSLEFLPLQELKGLLRDPENFCFACMDRQFW